MSVSVDIVPRLPVEQALPWWEDPDERQRELGAWQEWADAIRVSLSDLKTEQAAIRRRIAQTKSSAGYRIRLDWLNKAIVRHVGQLIEAERTIRLLQRTGER